MITGVHYPLEFKYTPKRLFDKNKDKGNSLIYKNNNNNDPIYPTPPLGQDMTQGQFLSGV